MFAYCSWAGHGCCRARTRAAGPRSTRTVGSSGTPARRSTTAGAAWTSWRTTRRRRRRRCPTAHARSSPTTNRRTSRSTSRSTPTAAASMAASTAMPGRATAISASRPGSTSRPRSSSSTRRRPCLRQELARPGYVCKPISLGANTDPYQPLERRLRITRQVLEVLAEARHPVGIVTKSALVTRDIDLLAPMAARRPGPRLCLGHHARTRASPARWSRAPRHRTGAWRRSGSWRRPALPPA